MPQLAACNSAQGACRRCCGSIERSDGIVLLVPTTLIDQTLIARLRKYVLRSKVRSSRRRRCRLEAAACYALRTARGPGRDGATLRTLNRVTRAT